jgi:hypothetical protein
MTDFDFNAARLFGHDPSTSTWKEQADERRPDDLLATDGLPADARVQPLRPTRCDASTTTRPTSTSGLSS